MAGQSYDVGAWAALTRRLSPFLDAVLGLAAAALSVTSLLAADIAAVDPRLEPAEPLSITATLVAGLSLGWRRTRPVTSYAVFLSCCLVVTLTGHYIGLLSLVLLLSLYSLAVHGRRRDAAAGLVVTLLVFVGLALLDVPDLGTSDLVQACALLLTAWALGDAIRSRRAEQAERLRIAEHEVVTAREQAARAVAEERLRIARELHDVIAHSMSLIAVQAGVGAHVIRSDADAAEHALEVIAETSRTALTQTRWMLGLLRGEDAEGPVAPMHTIEGLEGLVRDMGEAGVRVALTVEGTARPLDDAIELAAYRIVQESLTNVLKHSTATQAQVTVTYGDAGVDVEVVDPGRGALPGAGHPGPAGGHGLVGLRERARLLGGDLTCGPSGSGGFTVAAHLPSSVGVAS